MINSDLLTDTRYSRYSDVVATTKKKKKKSNNNKNTLSCQTRAQHWMSRPQGAAWWIGHRGLLGGYATGGYLVDRPQGAAWWIGHRGLLGG